MDKIEMIPADISSLHFYFLPVLFLVLTSLLLNTLTLFLLRDPSLNPIQFIKGVHPSKDN